MAAGALFVKGSQVLLVRKTYGNRWDIPGGYVDRGESPAACCKREVKEELGIDRAAVTLLVQDWAPNDKEGDKVLYVFGCGELGTDESRIQLDGEELDHWEWVEADRLSEYVIPRLQRRLAQAYRAHNGSRTLYLEHGEPVLT
ncbi:RNA pyrophosphohydrolase [Amycolatopsis sp. CA-230715]|nr:RNA pyrophosphohydrolase [Amycolatopsis sp. CA-230715]